MLHITKLLLHIIIITCCYASSVHSTCDITTYIDETIAPHTPILSLQNLTSKWNSSCLNCTGSLHNDLTYSCSNLDQYFLTIDNNNGVLTSSTSIDREMIDKYTLHCYVSYNVTCSTFFTLVIIVNDINDNAPQFTEAYYYIDIVERDPRRASLVFASDIITDGDTGDNTNILTIVNRTANGAYLPDTRFDIEYSSSVNIYNNIPLDYETVRYYNLTLLAYDSSNMLLNSTAQLIINITDRNDNQPISDNTSFTLTIPENTPIDANLGFVTATDSDISEEFSKILYHLTPYSTTNPCEYSNATSDAVSRVISIDINTGVIFLDRELDYEDSTPNSYEYGIVAVNPNDVSTSRLCIRVSLVITDINDNTPEIDYKFIRENIMENTIDTEVTVFRVSDDDSLSNGEIQVKLKYNDNNSNIGNDIEYLVTSKLHTNFYVIRLIQPIDYELMTDFNFTIMLCDRGADQKCSNTTNSIPILNVNEYSPYFPSAEYSCNITEHAPIDQVYCPDIRAIDMDYNDVIHYKIVQDISAPEYSISSDYFRIASDGGILLTREFDYETDSSRYSFFIEAYNDNPATDALDTTNSNITRVIINILDSNDNTPLFNIATQYNITESAQDQLITELIATDNDSSTNGQYYFTTDGTGPFYIDVIDSVSYLMMIQPDREYESSYDLTLMVTDRGDPPLGSSIVIHINILDINDNAPVFTNGTKYCNLVNINQTCQFPVHDMDTPAVNLHTYTLTNITNLGGLFSINSSNGSIKLIREPTVSGQSNFTIELCVSDTTVPMISTSCTNIIISYVPISTPSTNTESMIVLFIVLPIVIVIIIVIISIILIIIIIIQAVRIHRRNTYQKEMNEVIRNTNKRMRQFSSHGAKILNGDAESPSSSSFPSRKVSFNKHVQLMTYQNEETHADAGHTDESEGQGPLQRWPDLLDGKQSYDIMITNQSVYTNPAYKNSPHRQQYSSDISEATDSLNRPKHRISPPDSYYINPNLQVSPENTPTIDNSVNSNAAYFESNQRYQFSPNHEFNMELDVLTGTDTDDSGNEHPPYGAIRIYISDDLTSDADHIDSCGEDGAASLEAQDGTYPSDSYDGDMNSAYRHL